MPDLTTQPDAIAMLQLRDLEAALGKLELHQREVILLVGLEEMSYAEVANVLNVPVGTVRSRLSRGRDRLRRLLGMEERVARKNSDKSEPAERRECPAAKHRLAA